MTERFTPDWDPIKDGGYLAGTKMDDGRWWCLMGLTLDRLRIVIADDQFTAGEHWCYDDKGEALVNYVRGPDHVPVGWSRHMRPDGTREYPDG